MGTASAWRRVSRRPRVASITAVSTTTLAVTECITHAPPVTMSTTSGSSAPAASNR
jgi:hypothetical protein